MYLKVDHANNELQLDLPDNAKEFTGEIQQALMNEFAFDSLNQETIEDMNTFIGNWIENKGLK